MAMETIRPTNIDLGDEYLLGGFCVFFFSFLFFSFVFLMKYFLSLGLKIMCAYVDFGHTFVKNS